MVFHPLRALHRRRDAVHASRHGQRHQRYPEASPCNVLYEQYPEEAGPLGNVEMTNGQELQSWLLVARPVSAEEAEKKGGCIKFTPLSASSDEKKKSTAQPHYFCITDPDDVVYGRSHYLPASPPSRKGKKVECEALVNLMDTHSVETNTLTESDTSITSSISAYTASKSKK